MSKNFLSKLLFFGIFLFGCFLCSEAQATNLTVAPVTSSYDNLIGATGARWTFTATTTGELASGDVVRFLFPFVNNGNPFSISNPTAVASTSITLYSDLGGQTLSNRLSNPSFESNTTSWSYSEGGAPVDTWARVAVTTTAKYGSKSIVMSATSTNLAIVSQTVAVTTSSLFSTSYWAKATSENTSTSRLFLQGNVGDSCDSGEGYFYNFTAGDWQCVATASLLTSSTPFSHDVNLSNADWQRISFSTTSPSTSTYNGTVTVMIAVGGTDISIDMETMIDAVQVEMGGVTTFNLGGTTSETEGVLSAILGDGPSSRPFIYGFVNTTTPNGTAFSYTFDGISNPVAQRSDLAEEKLLWNVKGGTPGESPTADFNGGVVKTDSNVYAAIVRAGGNMIVDQNSNITASAFTTSATNVTYTFTFTPTSSISVGEKIIMNFPIAYNNLLNNISVSTTELISQFTNATVGSFATSTVGDFGNIRITLVTADDSTDPGTALTVKIYGVTNPATAAVYGGEMGGPESKFTVYTAKDNGGVVDGSPFGEESGDFSATDGPPPTRAIHIGGTNNINILVYKQSGGSNVKLSDSEASSMKVSMGCPDKGFFVGQKKLATSTDFTYASYNNILDCNYIVNVEPDDKTDSTFYEDFLMPAQKSVPAIGGVTVTTSIVFGVPNASTTLQVTGGVSGQVAFMQSYSSDFMSFSPIFSNANCTGEPGFTATGTGWACLNLRSGQNWNFIVEGGSMGSSANITDTDGSKYWPPTIPSVYIASAGHTDLGPYAYVKADKNLIVNVKKAGTDTIVDNACLGVKRNGGGMFMGSQDMTCGTGTKTFKVPVGSITVEVGLPGFGMPQEHVVAITGVTTTKNIYVSQPTTFISILVQDSAGNKINGAPVFAHGNGFGQGMTNSAGTTTIYVAPGNYVVEGFAPGLGQLTSQIVTVPGSGSVSANFEVITANLGTVAGRVFTDNGNGVYDEGVDTPLSGVQIGAHRIDGTNGGNGTQTDSSGNYTLYLPAGTYEIGGWSSDTGGFQAVSSKIITAGAAAALNVPLLGQGTLHITIENASTLSPLFAGAFSSATGRGNGTDSWTISGTSKIANLTFPAGTYEFHVGSPITGELGASTTIITAGGTTNVTIDANAVAPLVTISGNVASSSTGIANATVWASKTGGGPGNFSTQTDSAGDYSLQVPQNSSYRVGVKILGYIINDVSTSTITSNITVDFALAVAGGTVSGHVINASSVAIANAWVSAKKVVEAGQMDVWTGGPTDGNGSFSLNVDSGNWTIFVEAPCYQRSSGTAIASNATVTTTLVALSGCTANAPEMQGFTPTTGGQMAKSNMSLDIPANALGTGSGTVSLSVVTTTPRTAANATALPNSVQRITASDSTGQPITTLNNSASLSITYSESDLPTGFSEANLQLGYFDETTGQWETVASTVDTTNNKITASINHFTDYGPILPNVPTAPTGLTATASSTSEIDLSWTASAPVSADYYIVYASTTALTDFAVSTLIATTTATSYSHTSLDASTAWYYKVAGYNTNGEGWNSSRANATTEAGTCSTLTGAATYNAYSTCGAATCSSGYTLSGSGAGATCTANSSGGGSYSDTTAPAGVSVVINSAATSTVSTSAILTLAASDASSIQMMLANDSAFTSSVWETFATSKNWILTTSAGTKTVYAKFKDSYSNISVTVSDTIELLSGITATTTLTIPTSVVLEVAKPAPVVVPTYQFTKNLALRSTGKEVSKLQQTLKDLGYFKYPSITTYFGPITMKALQEYQKANGLTPNGKLDSATRAKLSNGSELAVGKVKASPSAPSANYKFTKYLYIGSTGEEVKQLQQLLKDSGYFTYPSITSYFGPVTKAAVIKFQKAKDLKPYPGWVGPSTRGALNSI